MLGKKKKGKKNELALPHLKRQETTIWSTRDRKGMPLASFEGRERDEGLIV